MELDPEVVKETLLKGVLDPEKGNGAYKIKPIQINEDPVYSPITPYEHCKIKMFCSVPCCPIT
jgi:hypothetical protein